MFIYGKLFKRLWKIGIPTTSGGVDALSYVGAAGKYLIFDGVDKGPMCDMAHNCYDFLKGSRKQNLIQS